LCDCVEGLLNPLACPHHMSQSDEAEYREGVVLSKPVREGRGSYVNVGLSKEVQIDRVVHAGLRVTVKMKPATEGRCTTTTMRCCCSAAVWFCCLLMVICFVITLEDLGKFGFGFGHFLHFWFQFQVLTGTQT